MDYRALHIFTFTQRASVAWACIITHNIGILFHSGLNSEQQNELGGSDSPTTSKLSKLQLSTNVIRFRSPE